MIEKLTEKLTEEPIEEPVEPIKTIPGLVSVVIASWNNWPDLEMTIASALQQSYRPIEVIVVDNSSADATDQELAKCFGGQVVYIRQTNRGCAGAHNTGFRKSSGEFIQFMSGDDVLAPNKIEKQVEIFRADPELDIVYGDVRLFQTLGGAANWVDITTGPVRDMLGLLVGPANKYNIDALSVLIRRRVVQELGPWDESLYIEDLDYWLRAAHAGCRFGYCADSPMGFYRIRAGQKSKDTTAMMQGLEAVWDKALGYLTREPYRSQAAATLAHLRFQSASKDGLPTREALAKLALARATSPATVPVLAYVVGWVAVALPGAGALRRARWLGPIRRAVVSLLGYRLPK